VQDEAIRNLEIIGEADRNIKRSCPYFAAAHPQSPPILAYRMRNVVAHGYDEYNIIDIFTYGGNSS
jgi:uncharacterized protein with HEPN domain